jgi:hypothetical protein
MSYASVPDPYSAFLPTESRIAMRSTIHGSMLLSFSRMKLLWLGDSRFKGTIRVSTTVRSDLASICKTSYKPCSQTPEMCQQVCVSIYIDPCKLSLNKNFSYVSWRNPRFDYQSMYCISNVTKILCILFTLH